LPGKAHFPLSYRVATNAAATYLFVLYSSVAESFWAFRIPSGGAMSQLVASRNAHPHDADELYKLESQVRRHMEGRVRDFRLVREDWGLVLLGQTSSYYVKQLAQETVRQYCELPIAANRIFVRKLT
jgi:hypothetical protein